MLYQSIFYSLNYALGFIIIYLIGASLATKQPAMTASAIASTIANDQMYSKRFYFDLSVLIAKVWRSQMVSFVGNIVVVFPFALLFAYLIHHLNHHKLTEGEHALQMLQGIRPFESFCWIYAAYTGVLLFLSGIISGYIDNKMVYSHIAERIEKHPLLIRFISTSMLSDIGFFLKSKSGVIAENILLGFFLGMSTYLGEIIDLPIDIRHVTFSAGNFALAAYGLDFNLGLSTWIYCTIGVLGIGFINFTVSFSLAFYICLLYTSPSPRD